MILSIYNANNCLIRECEYESSYYDNDMMRRLAAQGYSFYVDGKLFVKGLTSREPENLSDIKDSDNHNLSSHLDVDSESQDDVISKNTSIESADTVESAVPKVKTKSRKSQSIKCLETGKIYEKQSQAARDLGIDPALVSDSIRTGKPRKGYTFIKI